VNVQTQNWVWRSGERAVQYGKPNLANRKNVTDLIWNHDNRPKICRLPVIDIREVTMANEGMLARAVPPGQGARKLTQNKQVYSVNKYSRFIFALLCHVTL
jgi:hypothetical protein